MQKELKDLADFVAKLCDTPQSFDDIWPSYFAGQVFDTCLEKVGGDFDAAEKLAKETARKLCEMFEKARKT